MGRYAWLGIIRVAGLCLAMAVALSVGGLAEAGDFSYVALSDGTAEITGWRGGGTEIEIPSEIDGRAVTSIGDGAFAGSEALERVALPDGVTRLGDGAFADCYSLEEIDIPASVTAVGENPFAGCENMRIMNIAEGSGALMTINGVLFSDGGERLVFCPRLLPMERYVAPEGIRSIDARAFSYCNRLLSVSLPDSVTRIGTDAFEARANLTLVVGRGSYGEAYARENDLKYTYPDAADWLAE